ncbi:hypothetical protein CYLTODRAFT_112697 [Cylindrobasidium torrendii FP15055 ss-10]|uniref:Uncharacterized protein n=1 Tax=Cylindrobasidium torrendii FP15055 ss-10 TaxID=1314674 RepID=A0A0D7B0W7_9AGAR|nr:hypothetical protein CYLTODRAFT_112697 [Cylindrobasidium torrendii FP15055 ss-10]
MSAMGALASVVGYFKDTTSPYYRPERQHRRTRHHSTDQQSIQPEASSDNTERKVRRRTTSRAEPPPPPAQRSSSVLRGRQEVLGSTPVGPTTRSQSVARAPSVRAPNAPKRPSTSESQDPRRPVREHFQNGSTHTQYAAPRAQAHDAAPKKPRGADTVTSQEGLQQWIGDLQAQLDHERKARASLKTVLRDIEQDKERLHADCLSGAERIRALEYQLQREQDHRQRAEDTLAIVRKELQDAEVFLNSSDAVAGEEVIGMVRALNSEILQFAAAMAALGEPMDIRPNIQPEHEEIFGIAFVDILRTGTSMTVDWDFFLQATIQAALMRAISSWLNSLTISRSPSVEEAFRRINKTTPQTVSGRWRALVRSRMKYKVIDESSHELSQRLEGAFLRAAEILGIDVRPGQAEEQQHLRSLQHISKLVIQIDRAIGEQVISQDLSLFMVKSGEPFDDAYMEDADRGHPLHNPHPIVGCPFEFGLAGKKRNPAGNGAGDILLKAKVFLVSSLCDSQI